MQQTQSDTYCKSVWGWILPSKKTAGNQLSFVCQWRWLVNPKTKSAANQTFVAQNWISEYHDFPVKVPGGADADLPTFVRPVVVSHPALGNVEHFLLVKFILFFFSLFKSFFPIQMNTYLVWSDFRNGELIYSLHIYSTAVPLQTKQKNKTPKKQKDNSTSYSSSYKSFRLYSYLSYACGRMQPHFWIETKTLVHFCFVFVQ